MYVRIYDIEIDYSGMAELVPVVEDPAMQRNWGPHAPVAQQSALLSAVDQATRQIPLVAVEQLLLTVDRAT